MNKKTEEIMLSRLNPPVTPKKICKECYWAFHYSSVDGRTLYEKWSCFCPDFSTPAIDPVNGDVIACIHDDIELGRSETDLPKCDDLNNKGNCNGFQKGKRLEEIYDGHTV